VSRRVDPTDLQAERAVLGGVLVDPAQWVEAARRLEAADFAKFEHGLVFAAMARLVERDQPIDLATLSAELRHSGHMEAVGQPYLFSLSDGVPRSSNVPAYADVVWGHSRTRKALDVAQAIQQAATATDADVNELLARAQSQLAELEAARDGFGLLDVDGQIAALDAECVRDTGHKVALSLPAIDNVLDGVKPGEVLGIMARPGIGKTLVLCHSLCGMVSWHGVVCFSLEMPAGQIVRRLVRMAFSLPGHQVANVDRQAYRDAFGLLALDATPALSVSQMAARVRSLQTRGIAVRAVCVDHLGLIGGDRSMTTYDRVSTQARELKEMAKRLQVAVILLIQVNRDTGGDGSRELHLGSARDSGVVEEACDYMVAMRRLDRSTTLAPQERERYRDVIFARVVKHRHGVPMLDEVAYRIHPQSLLLVEDGAMRAEVNDLARIAQMAGKGRR
jgi:replicative DNA helicase